MITGEPNDQKPIAVAEYLDCCFGRLSAHQAPDIPFLSMLNLISQQDPGHQGMEGALDLLPIA